MCSRSTERLISDSGSLCSSHYSQYSGDSDGNKRQTKVLGFVYFSPFDRKCACQSSSSVFSHFKTKLKASFNPFLLHCYRLDMYFSGFIFILQPLIFILKYFRAIPTPRLGQICSFAKQSRVHFLLKITEMQIKPVLVCKVKKTQTPKQSVACPSR